MTSRFRMLSPEENHVLTRGGHYPNVQLFECVTSTTPIFEPGKFYFQADVNSPPAAGEPIYLGRDSDPIAPFLVGTALGNEQPSRVDSTGSVWTVFE